MVNLLNCMNYLFKNFEYFQQIIYVETIFEIELELEECHANLDESSSLNFLGIKIPEKAFYKHGYYLSFMATSKINEYSNSCF